MPGDGLTWSIVPAAAGIALTHAVLGPDHYLPFVMLARARGWTLRRTVFVTTACGAGHVATSLLLGFLGILAGAAAIRVQAIERARGDWAAWLLIASGVAYAAWGARRALRRARGLEPHTHGAGTLHIHPGSARPHVHDPRSDDAHAGPARSTFWVLFIIFVLGPCEPLIPLVILPASRGRWGLALATALLFGVLTVGAMIVLTVAGVTGLRQIRFGRLERWADTLAGAAVAVSGFAIVGLGV
jgi:hypothetical protein